MADNPQDNIEELEKMFKRLDANGDGRISAEELGETLNTVRSVTVTEEEVKNMIAKIDTDGDGFISFEEFKEFSRANPGLIKNYIESM